MANPNERVPWTTDIAQMLEADSMDLVGPIGTGDEKLSPIEGGFQFVSGSGLFSGLAEARPTDEDDGWLLQIWIVDVEEETDLDTSVLAMSVLRATSPPFAEAVISPDSALQFYGRNLHQQTRKGEVESVLWAVRDAFTVEAFKHRTIMTREHAPSIERIWIHLPSWITDDFSMRGEWDGYEFNLDYSDSGSARLVFHRPGKIVTLYESKAEVTDVRIIAEPFDTAYSRFTESSASVEYSINELKKLYGVKEGERFLPRGAFPEGIRNSLTDVEMLVLLTVLTRSLALTHEGAQDSRNPSPLVFAIPFPHEARE